MLMLGIVSSSAVDEKWSWDHPKIGSISPQTSESFARNARSHSVKPLEQIENLNVENNNKEKQNNNKWFWSQQDKVEEKDDHYIPVINLEKRDPRMVERFSFPVTQMMKAHSKDSSKKIFDVVSKKNKGDKKDLETLSSKKATRTSIEPKPKIIYGPTFELKTQFNIKSREPKQFNLNPIESNGNNISPVIKPKGNSNYIKFVQNTPIIVSRKSQNRKARENILNNAETDNIVVLVKDPSTSISTSKPRLPLVNIQDQVLTSTRANNNIKPNKRENAISVASHGQSGETSTNFKIIKFNEISQENPVKIQNVKQDKILNPESDRDIDRENNCKILIDGKVITTLVLF